MNKLTPDGIQKNRIRREAARQGLKVAVSKKKHPLSFGYGRVELVDPVAGKCIAEAGFTLASIEQYLARGHAHQAFERLEKMLSA
jgi:hypothetical protein